MASTFVACVSGLASRAYAFFWCVWFGATVAALRFCLGTLYWFFVVGFRVTLRAFNLENHGVSGTCEGRGSSDLPRHVATSSIHDASVSPRAACGIGATPLATSCDVFLLLGYVQ